MEKKVALVTGAAKGIGKEIAITLAEKGYYIAVNYRTDKNSAVEICNIIKKLGGKGVPIYADMSKILDIKNMYKIIENEFGCVDLVVNNAGISSEVYFLDALEFDFDQITNIDWKGLFFSSQEAAKSMIAHSKKGVIVNISSNQVEGCWPRATIYAPTKAAVSKFTKNAAMELSKYGIRMVSISPGYTDVGWKKDDIRWKALDGIPLKRFATTKEIAEAVAYVASDQASYITGTDIIIDGGATLPVVPANDFV